MIALIKNGRVYAPEDLGRKDILVASSTILEVADPGRIRVEGAPVEVVDASEKIVLPGFVDPHVHILGGGGEGGPATRAPEICLEDIVSNGITTVIGCLGTDAVTRHMESLLAKARGLEAEGLTTYIFSGAYGVPPPSITGSILRDLVLIEKVIGAGEIAISDHRSSQPTFKEIAGLAAECRVGGLLGGKAGILHLHVGDGARHLELLFRLIRETEIPPSQVIPTHVNRKRELMEEAMAFVRAGGAIDLTAGEEAEDETSTALNVEEAIRLCLERQIPLTQLTVSSDSNGSLPVFDRTGNLVGLTIATEKDLLRKFRSLVSQKILGLEDCIRLFATNAARCYKLFQKGEIRAGKDADLLLMDENLELCDVFALGRRMMAGGRLLARGAFRPEQ
ncbi:MAG: beta-aspartyl-peptidase [Candidatus Aminicenantes bacterium]|nr:beta-aspartyl-peptidase [Candidatus Aminicenantes bacterium]